MIESLTYREMIPGEEQVVCDLVKEVFEEFVAPDYRQEGIEEFFLFANSIRMRQRVQSGGFVLLACQADRVVGMLEFVPPERIAMLFVSTQHQGIASELVDRAVGKARAANSDMTKITVHSSPYAEKFYLKSGFHKTGGAETDHGITYIPMELRVFEESA